MTYVRASDGVRYDNIAVRVSPEVKKGLRRVGLEEHLSLGKVVELACVEYLNRRRRRRIRWWTRPVFRRLDES